jgi:hypothetical protein
MSLCLVFLYCVCERGTAPEDCITVVCCFCVRWQWHFTALWIFIPWGDTACIKPCIIIIILVHAINIAPLRAAKLRSYWKQVFFFSTSTILSLCAALQENRYWNSNLKLLPRTWDRTSCTLWTSYNVILMRKWLTSLQHCFENVLIGSGIGLLCVLTGCTFATTWWSSSCPSLWHPVTRATCLSLSLCPVAATLATSGSWRKLESQRKSRILTIFVVVVGL